MVLCVLTRNPLGDSWADKHFVPHACSFVLYDKFSLFPLY